MEKLRTYLNNLSIAQQDQFAGQCETTRGYLRKTLSDGSLLNPKTCVLIEKATSGEVCRIDLRPDWQQIWPELGDERRLHPDRRPNRRGGKK